MLGNLEHDRTVGPRHHVEQRRYADCQGRRDVQGQKTANRQVSRHPDLFAKRGLLQGDHHLDLVGSQEAQIRPRSIVEPCQCFVAHEGARLQVYDRLEDRRERAGGDHVRDLRADRVALPALREHGSEDRGGHDAELGQCRQPRA